MLGDYPGGCFGLLCSPSWRSWWTELQARIRPFSGGARRTSADIERAFNFVRRQSQAAEEAKRERTGGVPMPATLESEDGRTPFLTQFMRNGQALCPRYQAGEPCPDGEGGFGAQCGELHRCAVTLTTGRACGLGHRAKDCRGEALPQRGAEPQCRPLIGSSATAGGRVRGT